MADCVHAVQMRGITSKTDVDAAAAEGRAAAVPGGQPGKPGQAKGKPPGAALLQVKGESRCRNASTALVTLHVLPGS